MPDSQELPEFVNEVKEDMINSRLGDGLRDVYTPQKVVCEGEYVEVNKHGERYIAEYVFSHGSETLVWNGEETPDKVRELNKIFEGKYDVMVKTMRMQLKGRVPGLSIVDKGLMMVAEQVRRDRMSREK